MQEVWLALIIGLIIGWIIEWLIDWRYWRKQIEALRAENTRLRRELAAASTAAPSPAATVKPSAVSAPASQVE